MRRKRCNIPMEVVCERNIKFRVRPHSQYTCYMLRKCKTVPPGYCPATDLKDDKKATIGQLPQTKGSGDPIQFSWDELDKYCNPAGADTAKDNGYGYWDTSQQTATAKESPSLTCGADGQWKNVGVCKCMNLELYIRL